MNQIPDPVPDELLEQMAEKFRLLADATRLAILRTLMKRGEQNVGQVVQATGRSQANVSKHLKQLTEAGLLARRKVGLQVFYRLTDPVVDRLCHLVCGTVLSEREGQPGRPPGPPGGSERP